MISAALDFPAFFAPLASASASIQQRALKQGIPTLHKPLTLPQYNPNEGDFPYGI